MVTKRILIIGAGSIGCRHFELLSERPEIELQMFSKRDPQKQYTSLKNCLQSFDPHIILICNKTSEHYNTLLVIEELCKNKTILIEKPLFDKNYPINWELKNQIFIAYNLRFHPILKKLKLELMNTEIIGFYITCGDYLPNWRPLSNYEKTYSAHKEEGGGVLRDLSHEIDYCLWLNGPIHQLTCLQGKYSELNITSDDTVNILAESKNLKTPLSIHLDYLSRTPIRRGVIQTKSDTIEFDLIHNIMKSNEGTVSFNVSKNETYIAEHSDLLGDKSNLCTLKEAIMVQNFIEKAEFSAQNKVWVEL